MTRLLSSVRWIYFVSQRFSKIDTRGRTAVTSRLASLGIAFGVMALIAVISVMNGFQMEFIDAIMEISSYHLQVGDVADEAAFSAWCDGQPLVKTATPFYEARGLLVETASARQGAALIRALPADVMEKDGGFKAELVIVDGSFDIDAEDSIILGYDLARMLRASVGSVVQLLALSGSGDTAMFSQKRTFVVRGIFFCNYQDINAAYAFVNLDAASRYFGKEAKQVYGLKLTDSGRDSLAEAMLRRAFPSCTVESWRSYNRSFFGALRIEKNVLMLLVFLIFVVVAVNIYNAMRRLIYERRQDIAVLSALGASHSELQVVFILKGLVTGLRGAVSGLVLGIFVCVNISQVFALLSKAQYYAQYAFMMLVNPQNVAYVQENPMFKIYGSVPARMVLGEITAIFFFGICASLLSSLLAGRQMLHLTVSEVLRDE